MSHSFVEFKQTKIEMASDFACAFGKDCVLLTSNEGFTLLDVEKDEVLQLIGD